MGAGTVARFITLILAGLVGGGCASAISARFADSVSAGILNQNDPEIVAAGAPAYLILIDGMITKSPHDEELLAAGAKLFSTYAAVFADGNERGQKLSDKAKDFGERAFCERRDEFCALNKLSFADFEQLLTELDDDDLSTAYAYATAMGVWIQSHKSDWNAVAELPKLEALLRRLLELDETYEGGGVHVMLGLIDTRLPESLGGKPEQGRQHFERAIALSDGQNLMAKVYLASRYARLTFDRELHDQVLNDVIKAKPDAPGLTLSNTLAQDEAKKLLAGADDYF